MYIIWSNKNKAKMNNHDKLLQINLNFERDGVDICLIYLTSLWRKVKKTDIDFELWFHVAS